VPAASGEVKQPRPEGRALNRICGFCGGALRWASGLDQPGRERAGNARESDVFVCEGCRRELEHTVSERFSGNSEAWFVRDGEGWRALEPAQWPRFG
jgi:hypothetical protein